MEKFHILGHDNVVLGRILDSLYSLYGDAVQVEIISNITEEQNRLAYMPYKHECIPTTEFYHEDWTPPEHGRYLLAAAAIKTRRLIHDFFFANYGIQKKSYASLIHKNAVIQNESAVGPGSTIDPGTVLAPFSSVGNFVNINRNACIGHHTRIGDFTSINPGCNIAGECTIGNGVMIGMGAIIWGKLEIGDNSIIGAGSMVTKSVPANTLVYGSPAKAIKTLD